MNTPCLLLTPTDQASILLRRYSSGSDLCDKKGYHDASVVIDTKLYDENEAISDSFSHADPRWPTHCECGYEFDTSDSWQYRPERLYQRSDTQALVTLQQAPVGAMWYATWMEDRARSCGPDGRCLVVRLPGNHDWMVDSRASNCGSPCANCHIKYRDHGPNCGSLKTKNEVYDPNSLHYVDSVPEHRCWVRHGTPPLVHVDKNGLTCDAGAGSISVPKYHGFLHNGELTDTA